MNNCGQVIRYLLVLVCLADHSVVHCQLTLIAADLSKSGGQVLQYGNNYAFFSGDSHAVLYDLDCTFQGLPGSQSKIKGFWKKDGTQLLNGQENITIVPHDVGIPSRLGPFDRIGEFLLWPKVLNRSLSGLYECTNNATPPARLDLNFAVIAKPKVLKLVPDKETVTIRHSLVLNCSVSGESPLVVEWLFKSSASSQNIILSVENFTASGMNREELTPVAKLTRTVGRNNTGDYFCRSITYDPFTWQEIRSNQTMTSSVTVQEPPYYDKIANAPLLIGKESRLLHFQVTKSGLQNGNAPVTGFRVTCDRIPPFGSLPSNYSGEINGNPTNVMINVTLHPGSAYNCSSQAENEIGFSSPSLWTEVKSNDEPPNAPPTQFRISSQTSSSVNASWQAVAPEEQFGEIKGYFLIYQAVDCDNDSCPCDSFKTGTCSLHGTQNISNPLLFSALFPSLRYFTEYNVTIAAYNSAGLGKANTSVIRTQPDYPGPPVALSNQQDVTPTSALLKWFPPSEPNGIIELYNITWQASDGGSNATLMTANVSANTTSFNITSLTGNSTYNVSVTAVNQVGAGEAFTLRTATAASSVILSTADDLVVGRKDANIILPCRVFGIPDPVVTWLNVSSGKSVSPFSYVNADGTGNAALTLQKVQIGQRGKYTCQAVNRWGMSAHNVTVSVRVYPVISLTVEQSETVGSTPTGTGLYNLTCQVYGYPLDGQDILVTGPSLTENFRSVTPRTRPDLSLEYTRTVQVKFDGDYTCGATNSAGKALVKKNVAYESPQAADMTISADSVDIAAGGNTSVRCRAKGSPYPSLTLRRSGGQEVDTKTYITSTGYVELSVMVTVADTYNCTASNLGGSASVALTISGPAKSSGSIISGLDDLWFYVIVGAAGLLLILLLIVTIYRVRTKRHSNRYKCRDDLPNVTPYGGDSYGDIDLQTSSTMPWQLDGHENNTGHPPHRDIITNEYTAETADGYFGGPGHTASLGWTDETAPTTFGHRNAGRANFDNGAKLMAYQDQAPYYDDEQGSANPTALGYPHKPGYEPEGPAQPGEELPTFTARHGDHILTAM